MNLKLVLIGWILFCFASSLIASEFRTFHDTQGRELIAKVTRVSGKTVFLVREDKQSFKIPISRFSEADQTYLGSWPESKNPAVSSSEQIDLGKVTEKPSSKIGRYKSSTPPKVLMGFASIPDLADVPRNEWTYVREHLDGLWFNAAGTGIKDLRKLVDNIKTRKYYFIGPVDKLELDSQGKLLDVSFKLNFFQHFGDKAVDPSLVLVNDYITKKGKDPHRYYCDGFFPKAIEFLEKQTGGRNPFDRRLFITTRNGQFLNNVYDKTFDERDPASLKGRAFSTMLYAAQGGGLVYETDFFGLLDHHQEKYIQCFNRARELGAKFVWLCPRGHEGTPTEYSGAMVNAYQWLAKNQLFPDEIVIIHYSRTAAAGEIKYLDMLPMVNQRNPSLPAPGSFTGAMYWAIKQREAALSN